MKRPITNEAINIWEMRYKAALAFYRTIAKFGTTLKEILTLL